ncbi:MAG: helix-hairpin-helix domain-containing protein [Acidimicrobiia bacterium]
MNHTAKNFIRFAGVVIGLGVAAWALKDKLLPAPEIHDEAPPRFREVDASHAKNNTVEAAPADVNADDDLTSINGIGPVTAGKLSEAGILTFAALAATDAAVVSDIAGTSEGAATKWIEAASTRS